MIFTSLDLTGAYLIQLDKKIDERGFFARYYCEKEFAERQLEVRWVQMNTTLTSHKGTIRGLHFQREPMTEAKVVRCLNGAIWDVIVDLRSGSSTFGKWIAVELNAFNKSMIYVPKGFAHGFQTLADDTELLYMHSEFYSTENEGGINYQDTTLSIRWPLPISMVSERDKKHPLITDIKPISL